MLYYEYTQYPHIFRECDWGGLSGPPPEPHIVSNRNAFVREFGISGYIGNDRPDSDLWMFTHCELYSCNKGFVYIISPSGIVSTVNQYSAKRGFALYKNLYSDTNLTYIRTFSNHDRFNKFMTEQKALEAEAQVR